MLQELCALRCPGALFGIEFAHSCRVHLTAVSLHAGKDAVRPPKDLVALGKPQAKAAGMGLTLRSDNAGNRKPSSQVQAQARLRLQRLQNELKKEKALQASLSLLF